MNKLKLAFSLMAVIFVIGCSNTSNDSNKANEDLAMPPKSTFIEPKLRSGITIYEF